MTMIQPQLSGLQLVINSLRIKMGYACDLFTPRVQSQEANVLFLAFHVDDHSESSSTYDMI
jgi:hypothetical protein